MSFSTRFIFLLICSCLLYSCKKNINNKQQNAPTEHLTPTIKPSTLEKKPQEIKPSEVEKKQGPNKAKKVNSNTIDTLRAIKVSP